MDYIISADIVNAILKYLGGKPYVEVFEGIQALQNLKKLDDRGKNEGTDSTINSNA